MESGQQLLGFGALPWLNRQQGMDSFALIDTGDSLEQDKVGSMGPSISTLQTASLVFALITQAQNPGVL